MSDAELRELERLAASGDPDALRSLWTRQARLGDPDAIALARIPLEQFRYLRSETHPTDARTLELVSPRAIHLFQHLRTDLVFCLVPGGVFDMGVEEQRQQGSPWDEPQRRVQVQPFLLCQTPCTQEAWAAVTERNPSQAVGSPRLPVESVDWDEVQGFCRETGLRLPSEAEWEYACRAGTATKFGFGEDADAFLSYGWSHHTHEVGRAQPNAFGLHDMHGNLSEWCQDAYWRSYEGAPTDGSAREVSGSSARVVRSGNWAVACSYRNSQGQRHRGPHLGFRPACSLMP